MRLASRSIWREGLGYATETRAVVAGFHSILGISLDALAAAQNRNVTLHETMHDRILTRTPDGLAHLRLKELSVDSLASSDAQIWAQAWCREIELHAAVAHESVATYCSIKIDAPGAQAAAIDALSAPYRVWYDGLAERIDAVFASSYVQYLIGWFLAELSFSTSFSSRLPDVPLTAPIGLLDSERPDRRFAAVLERLTPGALQSLLAELTSTATINIQSEAAWDSLPLVDRKILESKVSAAIRAWGSGQDLGIDTVVVFGDWGDITEKLIEKIEALEGSANTTSSRAPSHEEAEAGRITAARLLNRAIGRPSSPPPVTRDQLNALAADGPQTLLLASATFEGDCEGRQWIVAVEQRGGPSRGVLAGTSASTQDLWYLLEARRNALHQGLTARPISNFLVGVSTPRAFADHLERILAHMTDRTRGIPLEGYGWDRLMWYASGNFIEFLRNLASFADFAAILAVPLSFTPQGRIGVGRAPDGGREFDFVLHLIHAVASGVELRLLRILNPLASGYAMEVEDRIVAQGRGIRRRLEEFDENTQMRLAQIVGQVTTLWPEF
jgi:hypothetical protein